MKSSIRFLFIFIFFFSLHFGKVFAQGKMSKTKIENKSSETQNSTKSNHQILMNNALGNFVELMPFLRNEKTFLDPQNEKKIAHLIQELQIVFSKTKKEELLKQEIFATNNLIIEDNLNTVLFALEGGSKKFAHQRLKETMNLCFHCHAQLPAEYTSNFYDGLNNIKRSEVSTDKEYADYLFLVRNFAESEKYYKIVISNFLKNKQAKPNVPMTASQENDLISSLQQLMIYYLKIEISPKMALDYLNTLESQFELFPKFTKVKLNSWKKDSADWSKKSISDLEVSDNPTLQAFLKNTLAPLLVKHKDHQERDVDLLIANGILAQYAFTHPQDPDMAIAIYYIGMAEKELNTLSFYSLAESYFRECIIRFPKHEIAPKCYDEYEESMNFGFTGSSGVHLPPNIKKELKTLKALIEKKENSSTGTKNTKKTPLKN